MGLLKVQVWSKINFLFFVYDSDHIKEQFLGGANVRKMPLKSWQFSKKSYWDFI